MKNAFFAPLKVSFAFALVSLLSSPSDAAVKTYQVTGPVIETSDISITVQKGKDKWEIAREATTEAKGEIKKGDKVTVEYRMTAASIEAKGDAKSKKK